jgi:hypothetical protein
LSRNIQKLGVIKLDRERQRLLDKKQKLATSDAAFEKPQDYPQGEMCLKFEDIKNYS